MTTPKWRRWMRLRGPNPRADVVDEFVFHMEERIDALVARGMAPDAARAQAKERFGDIAGATAACTDIGERRADRMRWSERFHSVVQDLRYAAKAMRRAPGFTAATVLTIALGIGANTIVFSLLNALLFQPLDARRPDELVRVYTSGSVVRDDRDRFGASSFADYADLRNAPSLNGLAAWAPFGTTVTYSGATGRYEARVVSDNYFALIGRPLFRGVPPVAMDEVVVSHGFWRTTLASNPTALGTTLSVNGRLMRVAGITAHDFRGIEPSTVDLYLAMSAMPSLAGRPGFLTGRGERSLNIIGRLAPAATAASAERDLNGGMRAIALAHPESNKGRQVSVRRAASIIAPELTGGALYPVATLVFAATVVMLLIAGVNVAAVLLSRTVRRRREIAVRLSLGASRARIARQLITESVLLAGLSSLIVLAIVASLPAVAARIGVPAPVQPQVDVRVLAYALLVAVTAGLLFGIGPALAGTRAEVVDALRTGGGDGRQSGHRIQRALVVAQLAMSMLLLVIGSALLRSLDRQQRVDPGFRAGNLLVADFEDPLGRVDPERERTFTRLAVERLRTLPSVLSVSVASMAPLSGDGFRSTIHVPGYLPAPDESMDVSALTGGPELFRTLGVPLLRGRELTWADHDTAPAVVVNESMARRYWGSREPVGSFVELGGKGGRSARVIAVVGDARFYALAESPRPMYAVERIVGGGGTVLIRTTGDPTSLIPAVRGMMSGNDNPLTLTRLRTMEEALDSSLVVSRVISTVILGIGLLAITLAAVGLYGVVSYAMAGRSREFGIRMALGATREEIMRLVLNYGARLAAIGGVIGLVLGVAATRLMRGMLYGDSSAVIAIVSVAGVLGAITLIASMVPARRATAISPAAALRSD
jgi:putative ABC transport system permease protein